MPYSDEIRALIAEPYEVLQVGYQTLIAQIPNMQSWRVGNSHEALQRYADLRPHIVIIGYELSPVSGVETANRILACDSSARILLTAHRLPHAELIRALRGGVLGFVSMAAEASAFMRALNCVRHRKPHVEASLSQKHQWNRAKVLDSLSPRELEVFRLLAAGNPTSCVADTLRISRKTASNHLLNIKRKLGADGTVNLALLAVELGILDFHP